MNKIQSFTVNHLILKPGLYVSRVDGDITTYDLRTKTPNTDDLMDNSTMHSCEHMLATFLRNSKIKDDIIYFGPMGCQTGFYLLVRNANHKEVIEVLKDCLEKTCAYDGEVFGKSAVECGNYRNLDINKAKKQCADYLNIMKEVNENSLCYDE